MLRQKLVDFLQAVGAGNTPRGYTPDTINVGGRCAQLVRESVESALDLGPNNWEVAGKAHDFRKARGGVDRWAADYEKAAKSLGLEKPYAEMLPGDVCYWSYTARNGNAYGHTALFIGEWGGQKWYLENSDWQPGQRRRQGAKLPLGQVHVYVTPEKALTRPRTVITPTRAMRMEDTAPTEMPPALKPAPPAVTVDSIGVEPGQPARLPFIRLLNKQGQQVITPYEEAVYYGIRFKKVPGGVELYPAEAQP